MGSGEVGVPDQDVLEQELEELLRFNETLMRENELFESHLQRTNPQLLDDDDDAVHHSTACKVMVSHGFQRTEEPTSPCPAHDHAVQHACAQNDEGQVCLHARSLSHGTRDNGHGGGCEHCLETETHAVAAVPENLEVTEVERAHVQIWE